MWLYEWKRGQSAANMYEKWVVFFVMSLMDNMLVCVDASDSGGNGVDKILRYAVMYVCILHTKSDEKQ